MCIYYYQYHRSGNIIWPFKASKNHAFYTWFLLGETVKVSVKEVTFISYYNLFKKNSFKIIKLCKISRNKECYAYVTNTLQLY